jgi:NAD(P)-dependent dehydrogenase (short-subunit alcohol dehydrogenase family)
MGSHGGRIAVVTGGGRGIGQEYAVARHVDIGDQGWGAITDNY